MVRRNSLPPLSLRAPLYQADDRRPAASNHQFNRDPRYDLDVSQTLVYGGNLPMIGYASLMHVRRQVELQFVDLNSWHTESRPLI